MDENRIVAEIEKIDGVISSTAGSSSKDSNAGFQKGDVFKGIDTKSKNLSIKEVANQAFLWAGIIAVLVIVISGVQYVISVGDSAKVTRAKNTLTYAIVGLLIVIFAFTIVNFVIGAV